MTTKILIALVMFLTAPLIAPKTNKVADQNFEITKVDSSVNDVLDSVHSCKIKTTVMKEIIKDKVSYLESQQEEIKRTQRQIDSLQKVLVRN